MAEGPGHYGVHPAREIPRHIRLRLPFPELVGIENRVAPKLKDTGLEGHPCAETRLLEEHRDHFALQFAVIHAGALLFLEQVGKIEDFA